MTNFRVNIVKFIVNLLPVFFVTLEKSVMLSESFYDWKKVLIVKGTYIRLKYGYI
ncbi:hypothetical protein [Guptibacillus hwajinpoensis]|uniref:hypothetical protein n=1 Tax=Guptibacillus hwajinpoensis TaxID=208199 RepID=UPI003D064ECD